MRASVLLFQAEVEIQQDAVAPGQKVLIIDDLLATGGETFRVCFGVFVWDLFSDAVIAVEVKSHVHLCVTELQV